MSTVSTAVILAAGLGSRLKDRTKDKPKAFIEIDQESLIERSVKNLSEAGIERIIIGTGYLHQQFDALINKYPIITTHRNTEFASTGSMYTLFLMRHLIAEPFLLLEADLLYEKRALREILSHPEQNIILASGQTHSNDEVYIQADKNNLLENMSKDKKDLTHISGELVGISKVSVAAFSAMCEFARRAYAADKKEIHYEDDFVGISSTERLFVHKIDDLAWCEIDDEQHLERALNKIYPLIRNRDAG